MSALKNEGSRGLLFLVWLALGHLSACGTSALVPNQASVAPSATSHPSLTGLPAVSSGQPIRGIQSVPALVPAPALMSPADLDQLISQMWDRAHVSPASAAGDPEFLRRVTLDLAGRIPTLDEAEGFLADHAADKRMRLVETLLAGPDYAVHFADLYLDLFVGRQFRKPRLEKKLDPRGYFVGAFRENRGFDRIAREMLTFSGEILPNGPGVFLASHLKGGGPEMAASITARLFLGVQIQCAQCHDHPTDARYKQEDFYGLVAYFARTKQREEKIGTRKPTGDVNPSAEPETALLSPPPAPVTATSAALPATATLPAALVTATSPSAPVTPASMSSPPPERALDIGGPDNKVYSVFDNPHGQAKFTKVGAKEETSVRPKFLGRTVTPLPGESLRQTLARAVVDSDLFAKTLVDRTWALLFGRGIMEPWDDLGGEADPRHPALLTRLAQDFRSSGFDVKHLLRVVLLSKAYGLTSRVPVSSASSAAVVVPVDAGSSDEAGASVPPIESSRGDSPPGDPMTVFARAAVRRLTPEQLFQSLLVATGAEHQEKAGTESIDKKIERLLREYLFVFGDDEMTEINTFNGNIPQALLLFNGEIVNLGARARPGGTLARILKNSPDPETRLRKMFLLAFARPPTDKERERLLPGLISGKASPSVYEDVFFAMLTSTEMLTIH